MWNKDLSNRAWHLCNSHAQKYDSNQKAKHYNQLRYFSNLKDGFVGKWIALPLNGIRLDGNLIIHLGLNVYLTFAGLIGRSRLSGTRASAF